jgi:hypothetical protein
MQEKTLDQHDRREQIDAAIEESNNWIQELKRKTPSLVKQKQDHVEFI